MTQHKIEKSSHTSLRTIIGFGIIAILLSLGLYVLNFHANEISKNPESWAHFGDYLGGIFSFFSFMALLYTIHLQTKELKATREELQLSRQAQQDSAEVLRKQQFENTFFQLLNQIILQLDKLIEQGCINGCIETAKHATMLNGFRYLSDLNETSLQESIYGIALEKIQYKFHQEAEFSRFYFMIYQLLKLIRNSAYASQSDMPSPEEKQYSNLLRSMLSSDVLQLMAFYCYRFDEQSTFKKYQHLIERYSLFEHISFKFQIKGVGGINMLLPSLDRDTNLVKQLVTENKSYFTLMICMYYKYNRMAFGENDVLKEIEPELKKIKME